ncbi:MAG: hypothetical protein ACE5H4_11855 [Candidatus Thorarchaeota archaeon]
MIPLIAFLFLLSTSGSFNTGGKITSRPASTYFAAVEWTLFPELVPLLSAIGLWWYQGTFDETELSAPKSSPHGKVIMIETGRLWLTEQTALA